MRLVVIFCFLTILSCDVTEQPDESGNDGASEEVGPQFIAGEVYYSQNEFIEYHAGNLPIIIAAPHGGFLTPDSLPDRTQGTLVRDSRTLETALAIKEAIVGQTGYYPHVLICNLRRIKIDLNRERETGIEGHEPTGIYWDAYHEFAEIAKADITEHAGKGLYLDIHGHAHAIGRVEIGYLLRTQDLFLNDSELDSTKSSIYAMTLDGASEQFAELVRGEHSLGSMLERVGIPAVPSIDQPDPGGGNPYFTGGYATARHGSRDGGAISAMQLELHWTGIRDSEASRRAFGEHMADILDEYFRLHFGWEGFVPYKEQ